MKIISQKLLIILVIIAFAGCGVFGFLWWQTIKELSNQVERVKSLSNQTETLKEQCETSQTKEKTPVDETANWKVYHDKEYGYEIKYPQDWRLEKQTLMANLGHLSSILLQGNKKSSNLGEDSLSIDIWNSSVYSYDQLMEPPPGGIDPDSVKKEKTVINSQPATELSYTLVGDASSGSQGAKEVFVQKNQLLYKIKRDNSKECDQILSTFRFLDKL